MCTFKLNVTIIEQIDKYHKHCLWWRGVDINNKTPPKVVWSMVCTPKPEGGLGVLNLRTQNEALLLKHLHKFFNKVDLGCFDLGKALHQQQTPQSHYEKTPFGGEIS